MKKIVRAAALCLAAVMLWACVLLPARAEKTDGVVRVLLTKVSVTNRLEIALDGSYTLDEIAFQRGSHLVVSSETGSLMVYYEGMALNKGKSLALTRHETDEGKENGVRLNGGYALHPGDLYVYLQNGGMQIVLHAPVEEYLLGVVPYEMSDSFPLEALKAQAVAARTYALKRAGSNTLWDVQDNTNDQAYSGVKAEHTKAARAVKETAGICGYDGSSLADCYYSASNGGQTELPKHVWGNKENVGYLRMTDDPYDLENPESVVKRASLPKTLSGNGDLGALKEPILSYLSEWMESKGYDGDEAYIRVTGIQSAETALPLYFDSPTKIMTLLRLKLTVEGRRLSPWPEEEEVSIFSFFTAAPDTSPSPAPTSRPQEKWGPMETVPEAALVTLDLFPLVESALNLSINAGSNEIITVRETDGAFILESRRYGHGVGMSQRGAQWMAGRYEWNYEQILRFYYPGMALKTVHYAFALPKPLSAAFLSTPGPAATPTPRPTVMPVLSTPGPAEYRVRVTNIGVNSYLNLRAGPSTQTEVVRLLYYGQTLIVTGEDGDWLSVRTDDLTGYVMKEFVSKAEP